MGAQKCWILVRFQPVLWANPQFWAHLSHAEFFRSFCTNTIQQIGAGKQDVESIQIFADPPINYFGITKEPFDDQKWVLHFASNG